MKIKITNSEKPLEIDKEDFVWISKLKIYLFKTKYKSFERHYAYFVRRKNKTKGSIFIHREIMGLINGDGKIVDHIDGNGLNCKKLNLRICSHAENMRNAKPFGKSKFKGVSEHKVKSKYTLISGEKKESTINVYWRGSLSVNKKRFEKNFKTEIEAAKWYNEMAIKHHKEFARLNYF